MQALMEMINDVNAVLWDDSVLYVILGVGVLFTAWSRFCQYRALTHGVAVVRGKFDDKDDPGAINHFQALSTALSATVGLGNIAGVALAVSLGGPGAVFWMWVTGLIGMALKTTEVTQAMLYRNTDDPDNPHGGAMWVASKGFERISPVLKPLGVFIAVIFCLTLLVSTITGGNMFQAWNVADITFSYFGVNKLFSGIVMAVVVGMVILGGIKRIGSVTGRLVPMMCMAYLLSGIAVVIANIGQVPDLIRLIFVEAFSPTEAQGAFLGGAAGWAFLKGMQRSLFSSEAGQGSSPIAHSAAKTDEPVREGIVAGLEPFVDTLVVCTITALVILTSGTWNRDADLPFTDTPELVATEDGSWTLPEMTLPGNDDHYVVDGQTVFAVLSAHPNEDAGNDQHVLIGTASPTEAGDVKVKWDDFASEVHPTVSSSGVYIEYKGATLTGKAFDHTFKGLGKWMVPIAAWLFAISTMISWSYYGEQGVVYMLGDRAVLPYKIVYCALIVVAASPLIATETQLDNLSVLGTGVMLFANIPLMLIFGFQAMKAYHSYFDKLDSGEMRPHDAPSLTDVVEGKDVE
ncbi:MAG: alanine/glycine:cation symporter family protein [Planctomycetota bacterium]